MNVRMSNGTIVFKPHFPHASIPNASTRCIVATHVGRSDCILDILAIFTCSRPPKQRRLTPLPRIYNFDPSSGLRSSYSEHLEVLGD